MIQASTWSEAKWLVSQYKELDDTARLIDLLSAGSDVTTYVATYIYNALCMRECGMIYSDD